MKLSKRVSELPPYLFAEIDRKIAEKRAQGVDIIDFGIGDPDLPTPANIVEMLCIEASKVENQRYPSYRGMPRFRRAASDWIGRRFDVEVDPEEETLALIGSKEGIANLPIAFINDGDIALIPDPAYPVYRTGILFSGGVPVEIPLREENNFLPDLAAIKEETWRRAKIFFLNYPNNPTAAVADLGFFEELVHYARKHEVLLAHDNAYSEVTFDGYEAPSLLQIPGAKEVSVEFHSLSKTYNMTGWRIGFAIGGKNIIEAFGRVKTNIDSGVFSAVQLAAVEALEGPQDCVKSNREIYSHRRDILVGALRGIGWKADLPKATLYLWMKVPEGFDSRGFTKELLERTAIVVAPGSAYGSHGEGYVRFSLTLPDERLEEGIARLTQTFA
ncbi:MAG: LL-diaminopimelate aminotransferase [Candidatus Solincola sediminis]|uniref:Aminotransferase n=1 Tax=Candidatus Solincola sediminis TaxID=1797199 RepID=A0A1F2WGJ1_9ACTN|nr:MAG: LL-diaminopimelate aminotransferase [Candidatus Solincola sediminis]OFW56230.1 MAG: LL-diaminopimelate aminotransferase [Candidatus Solincola sediminis]